MAAPTNSTGLLAGAIRYALGSLTCVTPGALSRPTPCAAWDLTTLLQHVNDSLAALHEAIATGHVGPGHAAETTDHPADHLVTTVRERAERLHTAAATTGDWDRAVAIADRRLARRAVAAVGAVELAVHGWDVIEACGCHRPIPPALATGILQIVPMVVADATRGIHFAAPVTVSPLASPSDRLVALLGRNPKA